MKATSMILWGIIWLPLGVIIGLTLAVNFIADMIELTMPYPEQVEYVHIKD